MCGIAGIASPSGLRELDPILLDRMLRSIAIVAPTTSTRWRRQGDSRRQTPLDHRSRGRSSAANGRIGVGPGHPERRDLQLHRAREDLERRGHVFRTRATPKRSSICTRSTARRSCSTCGACSPSPSGTAGRSPCPRTGSTWQEAALLAPGERPADLRVGVEGILEDPEVERVVDREAWSCIFSTSTCPRRGRSCGASRSSAGEHPGLGRR